MLHVIWFFFSTIFSSCCVVFLLPFVDYLFFFIISYVFSLRSFPFVVSSTVFNFSSCLHYLPCFLSCSFHFVVCHISSSLSFLLYYLLCTRYAAFPLLSVIYHLTIHLVYILCFVFLSCSFHSVICCILSNFSSLLHYLLGPCYSAFPLSSVIHHLAVNVVFVINFLLCSFPCLIWYSFSWQVFRFFSHFYYLTLIYFFVVVLSSFVFGCLNA